MNIRGSEAKLN
jgi:hypothetical protein